MKNERLVSKWKVKLILRRLKQFDGLTWLTLTSHVLRQIYTTTHTVQRKLSRIQLVPMTFC